MLITPAPENLLKCIYKQMGRKASDEILKSYMCVCMLSCAQLFATPCIEVFQAPLFMGFPRQEHWSGLPFPSPEDLPNPGTEPRSPPLAVGFFTTAPPGKPLLKGQTIY